jgi:hypothetical protein
MAGSRDESNDPFSHKGDNGPGTGDSFCAVDLKNAECEVPLSPVFASATNFDDHFPSLIQDDEGSHFIETYSDVESHGTSEEELAILSSREYSVRASDPNDFASAWESLIPAFSTLLNRICKGNFAVNIFSFPERSNGAVPRVIYITSADAMSATAEHEVSTGLGRLISAKFSPIYLKLGRGTIEKSGWW